MRYSTLPNRGRVKTGHRQRSWEEVRYVPDRRKRYHHDQIQLVENALSRVQRPQPTNSSR